MNSIYFDRCSGKLVRTEKTANKCSCGHIIQPKEYHVVWKKEHLCKTCIMKKINSWIKTIQEFRDIVLRYTDPELYQKSKNRLKRNRGKTNDTKK